MNDDYRALAVFVAVYEAGSFSAAARRMGLSTSVISHHISKLEKRLSAPLFFRSTRSLSLTPEGHKILEAATRMVACANEALDALSDDTDQLAGTLRITMPAFGMNSALHAAVWRFAKAHPKVVMSLHSSDKPLDLVREGYDLAIRLGRLSDSTLKSRRIGTFERKLVASPQYLNGRAEIREPNDLAKNNFVSLSVVPDTITLQRKDDHLQMNQQNVRVKVDAVTAGRNAVLAGLGLMVLPLNEIEEDLRAARLVEILPDWQLPTLGIYAVWPDSGTPKKLTRRLIDFFVEQIDASEQES